MGDEHLHARQRHHGPHFGIPHRPLPYPQALLRVHDDVHRGHRPVRRSARFRNAHRRTHSASGGSRRAAAARRGRAHAHLPSRKARNRHGHGGHRHVGRSCRRSCGGGNNHRRHGLARHVLVHRAPRADRSRCELLPARQRRRVEKAQARHPLRAFVHHRVRRHALRLLERIDLGLDQPYRHHRNRRGCCLPRALRQTPAQSR